MPQSLIGNRIWFKSVQLASRLNLLPHRESVGTDIGTCVHDYVAWTKPWQNFVLNGNAVYPCRAIDLIGPGMNERQAWEMTSAALVMPQTAETPLIQNFWGKPDLAPTFVKHRTPRSPINAFTLDNIKEQTVLFHRCKDGSLIRVLRDALFPGQQQKTLRVVFPFHNGDGALLVKMLEFSAWLCGQQPFEACISYDHSASPQLVMRVKRAARSAFANVTEILYPVPEHRSWPYAANCAFQHAADFMSQADAPWLWCEADAVPLTPDWLHVLDYEYRRRKKPFFGPIVPGMGHMNGVGIYPAQTPQFAPRAMQSQWGAWDSDMKPDMIHLCYDASSLIQHCWGIVNNQPHPRDGQAPRFDTKDKLGWVYSSAVLFHRCKDGSLIDRLREA